MNPQELKAQCEKLWRGDILCGANRVVFRETSGELDWKEGELIKLSPGKTTLAFIRKCTKHYGPPALPANHEIGKLTPPKWVIENYKRNCPRNYKALIEAYGETRTKYDAPLPGEIWRKGKPIGINLEQRVYQNPIYVNIERESAGETYNHLQTIWPQKRIRDYRGQYYTLTDWARFKRRAERAKARAALHASRSPSAVVNRLYSQLRDLFGTPLAA